MNSNVQILITKERFEVVEIISCYSGESFRKLSSAHTVKEVQRSGSKVTLQQVQRVYIMCWLWMGKVSETIGHPGMLTTEQDPESVHTLWDESGKLKTGCFKLSWRQIVKWAEWNRMNQIDWFEYYRLQYTQTIVTVLIVFCFISVKCIWLQKFQPWYPLIALP